VTTELKDLMLAFSQRDRDAIIISRKNTRLTASFPGQPG